MLSENIKAIPTSKGLSQEELATRLNVVRQTVSKWEKGLSVPDSELLIKIAEIFEISVSELLGANIENEVSQNDIAMQLSRINEQLAVKNRRGKTILKILLGIVISIVVFNMFLILLSFITVDSNAFGISTTTVTSSTEALSNP